ncbi:GAF domain-containing protein [Mastigocoleus testarum]|uniref:GAF domain-containing protein n=1 Tax=Mastigocoleus testarum TaxID=996925 RepID=UPI0003FE017B|nr:GAF domain-containing protein [Mastigocoleus testarum]
MNLNSSIKVTQDNFDTNTSKNKKSITGLSKIESSAPGNPKPEDNIPEQALTEQIAETETEKLTNTSDIADSSSQLEKQKALARVISRIRESLDLESIFKTTVTEVRQLLNADRVGVFRFYPGKDWEGEFIYENVGAKWKSGTGEKVSDRCFSLRYAELYKQGRVNAIADIYQGDYKQCYIDVLEKFQIRANVVAPLLKGDQLWGLLCIHQCRAPRNWQESEIEFVSLIAEHLGVALQHIELFRHARLHVDLQKALNGVISRIRKSLDLDNIFKITVTEVRQLLKTDRVGVFRFEPSLDWEGEFIYEDVRSQWCSALSIKLRDTCFAAEFAGLYREGRIRAISDIYEAGVDNCHIQILERFQVRANVVAPLMKGDDLWGLLCIHNCSSPRDWEDFEIEFVQQIAEHLGVALQQADYLEQVKAQSAQLAQAIERERTARWQKNIAITVEKIRQSLDLETIFRTTTSELRQLLNVDRVAIYRFNADWSGEFVSESVADDWNCLIQEQSQLSELLADISECSVKIFAKPPMVDTYLQDTAGGSFAKGELFRICNDIYKAGFKECYIKSLELFQARAYIIVAIYHSQKLWGLLAVYQNSGPREWHSEEVYFLNQVSTQLGVALQQAEYLQQLKHQAAELSKAAERQRALKTTVEKIRQTLDIDTIFKATTKEVRQLLDVERVAIYRFYLDGSGEFVADSIVDGWMPATKPQPVTERLLLQTTKAGKYPRNEVFVPISQGEKLWGLLVAYQNSQPRYWQDEELSLLAQVGVQLGVALQQAEALIQVQEQAEQLAQAAERERKAAQRERALATTVEKIRQTLDINTIFANSTQESQRLLEVDRVAIYRFYPDWSGEFVAESVAPAWKPVREIIPVIADRFLQDNQGGEYAKGKILVVNDIYSTNYSVCHISLIEQMQARAYMVVPIFQGEKLWGLLGAYQNTGPRDWQQDEIDLLRQVSTQLGVGIQQAELLEQTQQQKEELSQTIKELQRAQTQLIHSEKMAGLGQLVAGVAHEINNPINFIHGNIAHIDNYVCDLLNLLNLYRSAYPHPESHIQEQASAIDLNHLIEDLPKITDSMKIGTGRIFSLVQSLRTFSRLDEEGMKAFNIHDGIDSTLLILQHRLKPSLNAPEIEIFKEYGNLPLVECNGAQLNQVFTNILSNAMDAIEAMLVATNNRKPKQPKITIRTEVIDGDSMLIRIVDNGYGIPDELQSRIFEPFFTTKEIGKGTGLGLSISYQIVVEKHGGQFRCFSEPDKGSEFWIVIPINRSNNNSNN